ncbi:MULTISPECIES: ABC transporter permease [unclassified Leisingera]|uniref:ABC transporter permease n=2 Tax=Leisingera TaxID=191028 RepID=UPI00037A2809|nr:MULTISPECIES: ABC transporter permease [unclassified Leisingera]KIC18123.1 ABC transporter permease [Leisingera sp. ANG-DT]KIC27755.1 ABC transporter permease [Leisingera sp. ANG-M6]KIC32795.1 ABC transporter permease [Leisingera sp. ANG-S5]KIC53672.1 ABC transporter permease [Leisingera sp. ANG-S]KID07213.1 ABC transporter permease [Leisingera sp. ANG1]
MFQQRTQQSWMSGFLSLSEVVFHSAVRSVRSKHNNAFIALGLNLLQTILFVLAFYVMFAVLGLRGSAIRGDFLLYVMSGVYLFMVHTKTVSAVAGAEGPSSPMMQHAPMNTMVALLSAAIGALYIQVLSLIIILFAYHVAYTPVHIEEPIPAFGMVLLAWITGFGVGLVFLVLKPWAPSFVSILMMIYQRANMIASGKMFLANTLPSFMLAMFDWNPLFHCIDQSRGYVFINYNPHFSSWQYAAWVALVLIVIGLMGEFYTRRHVSLSWNARR